ncbi:uncharacterized protein K441DRAFT_356304 [Cenococcum geophilum 1.58]|uniref:Uncharacterized protein n=1 Tax=Cenococcum geophilum 1.58 TaxID=794803 RepID=A0ACC8EMF5_9PEZI|nr:hypothetical protein K441DRAFT_356304 [Cenococcum geophilum 1.58]
MYTSSTLESRYPPTAATPFLCGITIYRTHLHAAKPCTPHRRKAYDKPLIQTALYSLYTLIHLAYSNTSAARVLGYRGLVHPYGQY